MISSTWISDPTSIPNNLTPDWKFVQPMHWMMKIAICPVDVSIVPSKPYLVVIEDAAATNSHHLVDDGLLESLVFPFRHLVTIPLLILLRHSFRSFRAFVV